MFVYIFCTPGCSEMKCCLCDLRGCESGRWHGCADCVLQEWDTRAQVIVSFFHSCIFPSIRFDHSPLWSSFKTKRSRRLRHEACHAAGGTLYSEVKWVHTIKSGKLGATTLLYWFAFSVKPEYYGPGLSVFTSSLAVNLRPWLFTKRPLGGVKRPLPFIAKPVSSPLCISVKTLLSTQMT